MDWEYWSQRLVEEELVENGEFETGKDWELGDWEVVYSTVAFHELFVWLLLFVCDVLT